MPTPQTPVPLDEYPIHQVPQSLAYVGTSDRNFYDRCYFNAHARSGELFLVTGLGVYPNLGVIDAYATVRMGARQWAVRFSDALGDDRMVQQVGGYRVEVVEPLHQVRLTCDGDEYGVGFDLTWTGSFPPVQEPMYARSSFTSVIFSSSSVSERRLATSSSPSAFASAIAVPYAAIS